MVIVENIYMRLKNLALLQVEIARVLLPNKTSSSFHQAQESVNMKINRREFLLKQTLTLSKWVCDFRKMWNDT